VGYTTSPVLKTGWATGPGRSGPNGSATETSSSRIANTIAGWDAVAVAMAARRTDAAPDA
jgi:hypothetical protein